MQRSDRVRENERSEDVERRCSDIRNRAERMIRRGCFLMTSTIGAFSTLLPSRSFWKIGVSRTPMRIHRPMPTEDNR